MQIETRSEIERVANANPRALARLERWRRSAKLRAELCAVEAAIQTAREMLRAESEPHRERQKATHKASGRKPREPRASRSYTAEADATDPKVLHLREVRRQWRLRNPDPRRTKRAECTTDAERTA